MGGLFEERCKNGTVRKVKRKSQQQGAMEKKHKREMRARTRLTERERQQEQVLDIDATRNIF